MRVEKALFFCKHGKESLFNIMRGERNVDSTGTSVDLRPKGSIKLWKAQLL